MSEFAGSSATVRLTLVVNGARLALSHVGPEWVVVKGDAELLIRVNESRRRRKVYLPKGVPGARELVPYSAAPF